MKPKPYLFRRLWKRARWRARHAAFYGAHLDRVVALIVAAGPEAAKLGDDNTPESREFRRHENAAGRLHGIKAVATGMFETPHPRWGEAYRRAS